MRFKGFNAGGLALPLLCEVSHEGGLLMTRRLASALMVTTFGLVVLATGAEAISSRTRLCVLAARTARRACVLQCGADFTNTFATCFGPGAGCAAMCISQQSQCLLGPVAGRAACEKDTDPNPGDGIDQGACAVKLRDALQNCNTAADPTGCASAARLAALQCNQDCQLLYAPAIQTCNTAFNDCTQACASCRNASDCPPPTP